MYLVYLSHLSLITLCRKFYLQDDCITNAQYQDFVESTGYVTESELYHWSFVIENQMSQNAIKVILNYLQVQVIVVPFEKFQFSGQ
ncbi:hypothetical protein EON65_04190 [archaeon]|nr:MAG: hypothetical protein EON65_04190 [archaeon]